MKKIFTLIVLSIIAFNAIHAEVTWSLSNDGTLTISGTNMPDYELSASSGNRAPWYSKREKIKEIVIEDGVTSIGAYAFNSCTNLNSVTIPNSVTSIGACAFWTCTGLTSITIPESVTSIGTSAFNNCKNLTSIDIPNSVTSIGVKAFYDCSKLSSVKLPEFVTSIGERAFYNCSSLTSINIPNGVTSIGKQAFYQCFSLTSITIPNTMTSIENEVFYKCIGLKSVNIPETVTSIGENAFRMCTSLQSVTISKSVTIIGEKAFYGCSGLTSVTLEMKYIEKMLEMCPYISSITILDGETSIKDEAFKDRTILTSVTLPESVTSIGKRAFSGCSNLNSINIPNSVTSIEEGTFNGCSSLTAITIPESVTSIGLYAFQSCSSLTSVTIPESVTSIGLEAFQSCSSLTSVTIPNSVTSIGLNTFYGCSSLTSITIPNSVTSIGQGAFTYCSSLTSVTIPNSVTNIEYEAFKSCASLTSITIPNSVKSIGKSAFSECSSLKSVIIPNSVTSIGDYAFYRCTSLPSITFPNSVNSIGDGVFSSCKSLTSFTIPNSVTSIGKYAFSNCEELDLITIPNSVTKIGENAFRDCNKLTNATIGMKSVGKKIFEICPNVTNVTIIEGETNIGENAFKNCDELRSITISNSVKSIGKSAFYSCSKLKSCTIGNSVTNIGEDAFKHCSWLTSIEIPNSVTSIAGKAFYGCSNLSSIKISNSVTSIGKDAFYGTKWYDNQPDGYVYAGLVLYKYKGVVPANIIVKDGTKGIATSAFYGCSNLTSITIPNSMECIEGGAFNGCSGLTYVTIGMKNIGNTFSGFDNITSVTLLDGVESIGEGAFKNCSSLTNITIPNSVTSIGRWAFSGTKWVSAQSDGLVYAGLVLLGYKGTKPANKIVIKEGTKGIADYAFSNCTGLTSITIPKSVTNIGNQTFNGCSGLTSITCEANTPPSCGSSSFLNVSKSIPVYVPANSVAKYKTANGWKEFVNFREIPDNQKIADAVIAKISAIGNVEYTDACKGKIDAANKAYNALTAGQKALVTNLDVLNKAQQTYETLKAAAEKLAEDKAKADAVIAKITAIGEVEYTDACKGKIDAANKAYNALTADQKALVTNLGVLTKAQQTYGTLKVAAEKLATDKAKADAVIAKITAIGKVEYTNACKGKIDAANKAYNALTADQKALVTNLEILTKAQQTYETLKAAAEKLAADKEKADAVIAKITAIGEVEYTEACKGKIDDASKAYNTLTDDQKALVTNIDVLTKAQQTYETLKAAAEKLAADKAKADAVIAKITAIGKVEYTDACKGKIDDASKAYNTLTDDQKALVTNLEVLTKAQQTYETLKAAAEKITADKAKADAVIAKITAIGKVEYTDACKGKIDDASKAYNTLTAAQKALVTNLDVLTKAQQTYETLKAAAEKLADDKAKAEAVIAKITAIGKVEYTDACKGKIDDASNAYDALTDDQKALVTNLNVLTKAKQTYDNLKAEAEKLAADKAKADAVIAKITAIGKVEYTDACKGKIDDASKAYKALTDDQKALVTNLNVLTKAQQTYDNLKAAAEKLAADKAVFDKYKSEIIAIIEALAKDDDSDAVKEIIRKAISDIESLEYKEAISIDDNKAKVQSFVTFVNEAVENQRAEDQKPNGIEELEFAERYNIYDLNGRKITNSMLKSGLYIRNGKKIVIK